MSIISSKAGIACLVVLLKFSSVAHSATNESEFRAAQLTADRIVGWLSQLPGRGATFSILSARAYPPLETDFAGLMETTIVRRLQAEKYVKLINCFECKAPQSRVTNDRVIVTKGAPDLTALRELGKKLDVSSFLVLESRKTGPNLRTEVSVYDSGTGEVLGTESFSEAALSLTDNATFIYFTLGRGLARTKANAAASDRSPYSFRLGLLEELGWFKGGFEGAVVDGAVLLTPSIALRTSFLNNSISMLVPINVGIGFSNQGMGIAGGAAIDFVVGSVSVIGLEARYLKGGYVPITTFVGGHVGVSFGR